MRNILEEIRRTLSSEITHYIGGYEVALHLYLSGGLDSTILACILADRREQIRIQGKTLTAWTLDFGFGTSGSEVANARRTAELLEIKHKVVRMTNYPSMLPLILRHFPEPRWNVWPYWLAEAVAIDMNQNRHTSALVIVGETGDEIFGGYSDRDYLEGWAGQIKYIWPAYEHSHRPMAGIRLCRPYAIFRDHINFCHPPDKILLRAAYADKLLGLKYKSQPPAMVDYVAMLDHCYGVKCKDRSEAIRLLEIYAVKAWLETR